MQVDIIYGLLHRRVRKRLRKDNIVDVDSLVVKVRVIEDEICDVSKVPNSNSCASKVNINIPRASAAPAATAQPIESNDRGATIGSRATTVSKLDSNSNENTKRDKRARCSFCKTYGHVVADCRNLQDKNNKQKSNANTPEVASSSAGSTNPIRCYGCGQPGVVRSKCNVCSGKNVPPKSYDFNTVSTSDTSYATQPIIPITIADKEGVAILDTGATCSVASATLHNILLTVGVQFLETERTIGLADGSRRQKLVLTATVPVIVKGRQVDTEFMVFPGENTRILLGRDFIKNGKITMDIAQESWHFSDKPDEIFCFVRPFVPKETDLMRADVSSVTLRDDEATELPPEHKDALNEFLRSRASQFATEGPPTDFAVHKIKVSEHQEPLSSPPYRLSPPKRDALEQELQKLLAADVIKECESPWASNVVLVKKKDGSQADETKPFVLKTDISGYALGAALLQGEGSDERPVEYVSIVLLEARDVHEKAQATQKTYADEGRRPAPDYEVGDLVLPKTQGSNDTSKGQTTKFIPRRDGPYRVKGVVGSSTYAERISDGVALGKYHASCITPFVGPVQAPIQEKRKRGRPRRANPVSGTQRLG